MRSRGCGAAAGMALWLLAAGAYGAEGPAAAAPLPGGWTAADVADANVLAAAQAAVDRQNAKPSSQNPKVELVEVVEARSQVVAGINYALTLKVRVGGDLRTATVRVWRKLEGGHLVTGWALQPPPKTD